MKRRYRLEFTKERLTFLSDSFHKDNHHARYLAKSDVWFNACAHGLTSRNEFTFTEENENGTRIDDSKPNSVQCTLPI